MYIRIDFSVKLSRMVWRNFVDYCKTRKSAISFNRLGFRCGFLATPYQLSFTRRVCNGDRANPTGLKGLFPLNPGEYALISVG